MSLVISIGHLILVIALIIFGAFVVVHVFDKTVSFIERANNEYDSLEYELIEANRPYKCHCGIVSRHYQFSGHHNDICPQCNESRHNHQGYSYMMKLGLVEDDREFPFAPKITIKEIKRMRKKKLELGKIEKEMQNIEATDREIEAWEKLQIKKIAEYEKKAEELKKELLTKQ